MYDIQFPNLGWVLENLKDGISIGGVEIKFYGIIITLGFIVAYLLVAREAKKTNQNPEDYLDYLLYLMIPAIVGARIYYVIFNWDAYFKEGASVKDTLLGIINIRNGGLAIYGGIIAGLIVLIIFVKKRKLNIWLMADTCTIGLLAGQIIGRFGNFFNREAFGEYTDSLFAMGIPVEYFLNKGTLYGLVNQGIISQEMINHIEIINGLEYIQVHPTFLYEGVWNLGLLVLILLYRKHKKFDGELVAIYFWGYGLGRVWIEGLRTDSLMVPGLPIKVSQLVAAICVICGAGFLIWKRVQITRQEKA